MPDQAKNDWQESFLRDLDELRSHWVQKFDEVAARCILPVYEEMADFLGKNGLKCSAPLTNKDRRAFRFEFAENAYLLLTFTHDGIEDLLLKVEYFVPGGDPGDYDVRAPLKDLNEDWARDQMQRAMDAFVRAFKSSSDVAGGDSPADLELLAV